MSTKVVSFPATVAIGVGSSPPGVTPRRMSNDWITPVPSLAAGMVQVNVACPLPAAALSVGGSGGPPGSGVADASFDVVATGPGLIACNTYECSASGPGSCTSNEVCEGGSVATSDDSSGTPLSWTSKPVTAGPTSAGVVHERWIASSSGVAVRSGAAGVAGSSAPIGVSPSDVVAVTV